MSTPSTMSGPRAFDFDRLASDLYRDGIIGLPGCFPPDWADVLREDFEAAFADARSHPKGTISRGPQRFYFAVHPERIRGFVDLVSHPAITGLCAEVLGPDYLMVELGFDVPLAGAQDQPWHRDFRTPPDTATTGRLTSLAFNITTVDVTPDLAPFEIAPGTHLDDGATFEHGMFPPPGGLFPLRGAGEPPLSPPGRRGGPDRTDDPSRHPEPLRPVTGSADPRRGDRRHRPGRDRGPRPGADPPVLRRSAGRRRPHLHWTLVDELTPIVQKHDIEGLMMGG